MHVFDPHQSHAANVVKNTKSSFNQKILKTFFIFNFTLDQKITKKGKINAVVSTLWILILALARRKPRHVDQCQQNKSKKFKDYRSLSSTLKASSYLHAKRYKTHQRTVRWLFPIKRFWKISKTRTNGKLKKKMESYVVVSLLGILNTADELSNI